MARDFSFGRKSLWATLGAVVVVGASVFSVAGFPRVHAQSPADDWQAAAGGKIAFDVASIKLNNSGEPAYRASSSFPLGLGESYSPNGGLFSATNFPVSAYIGFAYKLTPRETQALQLQLPKWAKEERFDIQARTAANSAKDQMRLMMQSLLADRFKLAVHSETQQGPVFALVLVKPGKIGPQLHPHSSEEGPCGAFTLSPSARLPDGTPSACDVFLTLLDTDRAHSSARNVTMSMIANSMPLPGMGAMDRPVQDQTGLSGTFDFSLEWTPESTAGPSAQTGEQGPTFLEALRDQLGLKLESTTGPINAMFVDHIEQPSEN